MGKSKKKSSIKPVKKGVSFTKTTIKFLKSVGVIPETFLVNHIRILRKSESAYELARIAGVNFTTLEHVYSNLNQAGLQLVETVSDLKKLAKKIPLSKLGKAASLLYFFVGQRVIYDEANLDTIEGQKEYFDEVASFSALFMVDALIWSSIISVTVACPALGVPLAGTYLYSSKSVKETLKPAFDGATSNVTFGSDVFSKEEWDQISKDTKAARLAELNNREALHKLNSNDNPEETVEFRSQPRNWPKPEIAPDLNAKNKMRWNGYVAPPPSITTTKTSLNGQELLEKNARMNHLRSRFGRHGKRLNRAETYQSQLQQVEEAIKSDRPRSAARRQERANQTEREMNPKYNRHAIAERAKGLGLRGKQKKKFEAEVQVLQKKLANQKRRQEKWQRLTFEAVRNDDAEKIEKGVKKLKVQQSKVISQSERLANLMEDSPNQEALLKEEGLFTARSNTTKPERIVIPVKNTASNDQVDQISSTEYNSNIKEPDLENSSFSDDTKNQNTNFDTVSDSEKIEAVRHKDLLKFSELSMCSAKSAITSIDAIDEHDENFFDISKPLEKCKSTISQINGIKQGIEQITLLTQTSSGSGDFETASDALKKTVPLVARSLSELFSHPCGNSFHARQRRKKLITSIYSTETEACNVGLI